jgi:tetratricopeptide (TPR) repeat protein
MNNSELIENYFSGNQDPSQVRAFENRIVSDPPFAEEVAFYLSVHSLAREIYQSEKKQQFKQLYQKSQATETSTAHASNRPALTNYRSIPVRRLIYYTAAAATITGIFLAIYSYAPSTPHQFATKYEKEELRRLNVTMGVPKDSVQISLNFYNTGQSDRALAVFERMFQKDSTDYRFRQYAGLAALRLKDYDKAMRYFKKLETYSLQSNPGLFYQAITLMDRNQPGDTDTAKQLLQQVVDKDLEGKETAQEWLSKWKN